MTNINELCNDGFRISSYNGKLTDFSFISLRVALYAYFSTYKSMKYNLISMIKPESYALDDIDEFIDSQHSIEYVELYADTIVHFQHFIELTSKEILRKDHELLVLNINIANHHNLLYDLLHKKDVPKSILEGQRTIEFGQTLERLYAIIDELDPKYSFFVKDGYKTALNELNLLRNKIWHRGTFVLHYNALDTFIGKYLLPIIIQITELPEYQNYEKLWKYSSLHLGIDPINEIINEYKKDSVDIGKIAFLKELGRSAYENPLKHKFKLFNNEIIKRAERIAKSEIDHPLPQDIYINTCPVCGIKSLVTYEESDSDVNDDGSINAYWTYVNSVRCFCCSFELFHQGMKNPKEYGYNYPDFWYDYDSTGSLES
jgi:hypothetical protein